MSRKLNLNSLKWLFMAIVIAFPICCMSQTIEIITEKPGELVDKLNDNKDFSELIIEGSISTFDMANLRRFLSKEDKSYSLDIRKSNILDYDGNHVNGIPENFFAHFKNLVNVKLSNNIKFIGKRSFFETGITHIDIPSSVDSIFDEAFGQSQLSNINLNEGLKYIGDDIFFMCYLKKLHIPASVDSISGCLYPMGELYTYNNISIDKNNKKYELIDYVIYSDNRTRIVSFLGCDNFNIPSTVKQIGDRAFCRSPLTYIVIPESISHIGEECFMSSRSLEKVDIRGSSYISDRMFYGCSSLKDVIIRDNIKEIKDEAFSLCENLCTINIPKEVNKISGNAFRLSKNIDINITPQNKHLTSTNSSIYSKDMEKLIIFCGGRHTQLNIPEGVESIEKNALNDMLTINKIVYPSSLKNIDSSNLYSLTNIETVNVVSKAEVPPRYENYKNSDLDNFRLFVPDNSIEAYKNAIGWSDFKYINGLTQYDNITSNDIISYDCNILIKMHDKTIVLNTKHACEYIKIYDFKGIMRYQGKSDGQDTHINLPKGKYIIECGKERLKISL